MLEITSISNAFKVILLLHVYFLFAASFAMLSISQIFWCRMVGNTPMIGEKCIWKVLEGSVHGLVDIYPGSSLDVLRQATKHLSQDSQCPGRDSNRAPPEYKSSGLVLFAPTRYKCIYLLFI
jgi:hypothetical protein